MGVPSFFRYLQRRYPLIVSSCVEEGDGADPAGQNPNTIGTADIDNLYLDMNGIIHPCFHPEGRTPNSEEEIFANIDAYITRVFNIVRPRKLLFMAIDGVAPRAKMNQQRARRYRAAKDAQYHLKEKISTLPPEATDAEKEALKDPLYLTNHDTNTITPGTEFMANLAEHLRHFISKQRETSQAWKSISIILSDASVPGEGEHKIMSFIRSQRLKDGYQPDRRHCVYGLDADIIFLGLSTHELYFTVLRESILPATAPKREVIGPQEFHFVNLWVLRQYLERDLRPQKISFEWNFEYALDDLIFLCFAAGNDFLPHVPGLSIQSGMVDQAITAYRNGLSKLGGYITSKGLPNIDRFVSILTSLTETEKKELHQIVSPSEKAAAAQEFLHKVCTAEDPEYMPESESKMKTAPYANNEESIRVLSVENLKKSYYATKFGADYANKDAIQKIVKDYALGMVWSMRYYMYGCQSWDWYYPYFYSPCASDFYLLDQQTDFSMELGKPFPPLVQLLSVLPPQSVHCLPKRMGELMIDPESPIHSYYPSCFDIDLNGETALWKALIKVPFIDSELLLRTVQNTHLHLRHSEKKRNEEGRTRLFISTENVFENGAEMNGPQVWGKISAVEEAVQDECYFEWNEPPYGLDLSFLLSNDIKEPNIVSLRRALDGKDLPLSILGIPMGCSPEYRLREQQKKKETSADSFLDAKPKKKRSVFNF